MDESETGAFLLFCLLMGGKNTTFKEMEKLLHMFNTGVPVNTSSGVEYIKGKHLYHMLRHIHYPDMSAADADLLLLSKMSNQTE